MKKIYLFIIAGLIASLSYGQVKLAEDFSSGCPPTGWTIEGSAPNWGAAMSSNAGGTMPEGHFSWSPQIDDMTRLISPVIDLTGVTTLLFDFKHALDDYGGGAYSIGIGTRSGSGDWNVAWSVAPMSDIAPTIVSFEITTADVGAADFQLCIFFDGNSYNMNDWYFDDVRLFAPMNLDAGLVGISLYPYQAQGDLPIEAVVQNDGLTEITSFDVVWSVGSGTEYTTSVSGVSLATGDMTDVTCTDLFAVTAGTHNLSVSVANVNGTTDDQTENNTKTMDIYGASQSVTRLPFFEEFTSSTCGPCTNFNANVFTPFLGSNEGDLAIVKYQMSWPTPGDPYYTEEGGVRRNYYAISAVPALQTDGGSTATTNAGVNGAFTQSQGKAAFLDIQANHTIDGDEITVNVTLSSYADMNQFFTAHVVVVENQTTGNVGNNGETEFHYVMMKMLPNAAGTSLDLTAGTPFSFTETADLSTTNVEEMSDLSVVVFVQWDMTHEVFQSAWSLGEAVAPTVAFTPTDGATDIAHDSEITLSFNQAVRLIDDSPITDPASLITFKETDASGADIAFTATINAANTMITVTPTESLVSEQVCYVAIGATVENNADLAIEAVNATFTIESYTGIEDFAAKFDARIYPNPTSTNTTLSFTIEDQETVALDVYDITGKIVMQTAKTQYSAGSHNLTIDTEKIEAGIYFIKIQIGNNVASQKISVVR